MWSSNFCIQVLKFKCFNVSQLLVLTLAVKNDRFLLSTLWNSQGFTAFQWLVYRVELCSDVDDGIFRVEEALLVLSLDAAVVLLDSRLVFKNQVLECSLDVSVCESFSEYTRCCLVWIDGRVDWFSSFEAVHRWLQKFMGTFCGVLFLWICDGTSVEVAYAVRFLWGLRSLMFVVMGECYVGTVAVVLALPTVW